MLTLFSDLVSEYKNDQLRDIVLPLWSSEELGSVV